MELKGFDGTATLTDTHLVFDFKKRVQGLKGTARNEIALHDIVAIQLTPPTFTKRETLRVRTVDSELGKLEMNDPNTLLLGSRPSGAEFIAAVLARSSAVEADLVGEAEDAKDVARTEAHDRKAEALRSNPTASFAGYHLAGGQLRKDLSVWDVRNSRTSVDVGSPRKGLTATRVVLLGVFSLVAKKDKTKIYVTIETPTETLVVEGSARDERQARLFASAVERSV